MTLKQFLYLGTGSGIAYATFVFGVTKYPIVAWPITIISALLGAAFAFLPIASRPLDHCVKAFFKAVYSPTQRVWQKNKHIYKDNPFFQNRYLIYMTGWQPPQTVVPPQTINNTPIPQLQQYTPIPTEPKNTDLPTSEDLKKTVELAKEAQALQVKIIQSERALNQIKSASKQPTAIPVNYTEEVNKVVADLQKLVTQASDIQSQLSLVVQPKNTAAKPELKSTKNNVKVVIPVKPKQTQIALTTFPNVISGIVENNKGDYLEGVVAVIYDKEGLPVRALKTNKLGQFSGSTPLPNGTYNLELEKDGYSFDVLQIQLDGEVLPPLMITTKEARA